MGSVQMAAATGKEARSLREVGATCATNVARVGSEIGNREVGNNTQGDGEEKKRKHLVKVQMGRHNRESCRVPR